MSSGRNDGSSALRYCGQAAGKSTTKFGVSVVSTLHSASCMRVPSRLATSEFCGSVSNAQRSQSSCWSSHATNASAQTSSLPGDVMKSSASESPDPAPTMRNVVRVRPKKEVLLTIKRSNAKRTAFRVSEDQTEQFLVPGKCLPPGCKPFRSLEYGGRWICLQQTVPAFPKLLKFFPGTAYAHYAFFCRRAGFERERRFCLGSEHGFASRESASGLPTNAHSIETKPK